MLVRHGIAEARAMFGICALKRLIKTILPAALSDTTRRLTAETAVAAKVESSAAHSGPQFR